MASKVFRDFRVQYAVTADQPLLCLRCRTETMQELHRVLCAMNGFRLPVAQWHDVVVHETEPSLAVCEYNKEYLSQWDYLYSFKGAQREAVDDVSSDKLGERLSVVAGKSWKGAALLSTSNIVRRLHVH